MPNAEGNPAVGGELTAVPYFGAATFPEVAFVRARLFWTRRQQLLCSWYDSGARRTGAPPYHSVGLLVVLGCCCWLPAASHSC
jgi:hypothetical protein